MGNVQKLLNTERASWVFDHNITWEDDIWKADPFDVEIVHANARAKFFELLSSVTDSATPAQNRVVMFQGQSGAGKTHLLRALRTQSHTSQTAYFGYAQMTPDVRNYADYYLRRLINSLEKPHNPFDAAENSFIRMSNVLGTDAELLSWDDLAYLREEELNPDDLAELIVDIADGIISSPKFENQDLDINIIRSLLYLQRNDPRVDQRVRQYLYGRPLNESSMKSISALDPSDSPDRAFEIIEALGRIMWTTERRALVFCIDQVEDLRFFDDAEERFQRAIRDLIQIANRVPSSIIVISCLDDFYFQMRDFLPQSFIDRIEKAGPIHLKESRTIEEARLIIEKRLNHIVNATEHPELSAELSQIFGENFVQDLVGLSTRRLLEVAEIRRTDYCAGRDFQTDRIDIEPEVDDHISPMQQNWERFVLDYHAEIPEDDRELCDLLIQSMELVPKEFGDNVEISTEPGKWFNDLVGVDLHVEHGNGSQFQTRLFFCNKRSQGGSLKRQIEHVLNSSDGIISVIIRAGDFPPNAKSATGKILRRYVTNGGRRLVVPIYEWERMITYRAFREKFSEHPEYGTWAETAQILKELPSIRQLLRLENTSAKSLNLEEFADGEMHPLRVAKQASEKSTLRQAETGNVHHLNFPDSAAGAEQADQDSSSLSNLSPAALQWGQVESQLGNDDHPGSGEEQETSDAEVSPQNSALLKNHFASYSPNLNVGRQLGTEDDSVELPVSRLTRHAAFLGGSGSGKTTLALSMIENLLLRGIPVILIDRKGDLCSYANPDVWLENNQNSSRDLRQRLRELIDVAVYTPGRVSGRPISITLLPNGIADLPSHEQQQLANVSAAALGDMLHLGNSATHQRQEGILTVGLRMLGETAIREVTLADLIGLLEDDFTELVDETQRMDPSGKLRRDLVAQLDSLRHRNWALFEGGGEPLSMDSLLGLGQYAKEDKTRLSVVYTGFLGDNENILFWVAQFLSEALRFCQRNPNEELQAVIMFDEADLYIPANSKPATKEPLESLLKRARSAGIGLMLATQSPGDLDYKSRDQITSWFIGKVREDTALKKLKAAFSSDTGIDPVSALPNQKVGEFHLIQEGTVTPIKSHMSLIEAQQVPFDRIEKLSSVTVNRPKKQLLLDLSAEEEARNKELEEQDRAPLKIEVE